jgi:hypothetical protein
MSLEDFQTPQQLDLIKQISSRYSIAVGRIQITGIITGIRAGSVQIDLLLLPPHASDPFAPLSSTVAARLVADFASARWDVLFAKQVQPTSPDITSPPTEPTNAPSPPPAALPPPPPPPPPPTRTPVTVVVAPPVREEVDLIVLIEPGVQLFSAGGARILSGTMYSRGARASCARAPVSEMRNALRPAARDAGTAVFQPEDADEFVRGVSAAYGTSEDRVEVKPNGLTETARPGVCPGLGFRVYLRSSLIGSQLHL